MPLFLSGMGLRRSGIGEFLTGSRAFLTGMGEFLSGNRLFLTETGGFLKRIGVFLSRIGLRQSRMGVRMTGNRVNLTGMGECLKGIGVGMTGKRVELTGMGYICKETYGFVGRRQRVCMKMPISLGRRYVWSADLRSAGGVGVAPVIHSAVRAAQAAKTTRAGGPRSLG